MDETFLALQRALAGEYSLEREIGRGGMGIVYLARDVQLDRLVAIKVLPAELTSRDDVRTRFIREARTAAGLSHPNIVPIHRVGEAEGLPYFVMTYVRGETLGDRLRARGPLTPAALSRVVHDVALALGYAHGRGVIHRDVKPDNILLEEESGRAMVSDFGIARITRDDDDTEAGILGTLRFMSPEQARGDALDGRSDIYSLGVVAVLAATGHFPGESAPASNLPGGLARVVDGCLRLEPSERFRNAEEIATALDAAATPARTAVPEVIRQWTSDPAPLLNVYGFWSAGWIILTASQFSEWIYRGTLRYNTIENILSGLALAAAPLLPIAVFQLRKTHRALEAGYNLSDLREALRAWIRTRRQELDAAPEPRWTRMLRAITWVVAVSVPTAMITSDLWHWGPPMTPLVRWMILGPMFLGIGTMTTLSALGRPLFAPKLELGFIGALRSRLWNSRFGAWLANRLTPAERGVPEAHFRPTELALKLAVEDLFAALPREYRQLVGDLPPVAARLSDHVAELRREVERLEVLRSGAHREDEALIDDLLAAARKQLGQAVGALERMRLELLRLHGGDVDMRPLTTSLDAARAMVEDLVRLRVAEGEVDPVRRPLAIDLRKTSPA